MPRRLNLRGVVVGAVAAVAVTSASWSVSMSAEQPTPSDVADLADHIRSLPPKSYDVEVIVEFQLKKKSEESLRKSVNRMFDRTDEAAPGQSREERTAEIEKEVRRLMDEQERPRRMRKRFRYSDQFGYRVETVTERPAFEGSKGTGPIEKAPYHEAYVNVGPEGSNGEKSVALFLDRKIALLLVDPGARVPNEHVWTGGTIGWPTLAVLKSALHIGKPDEPEQISRLVQGQHSQIRLQVERNVDLPDGTKGRRFDLTVFAGLQSVMTSLYVPAESFNPVWKVVYANGHVPREVVSAKDGVAQVWIDRDVGAPDGGRTYTLISKALNIDLDPQLFAFKAPEGFTYEDHSVNPRRIVHADGRTETGTAIERPPIKSNRSQLQWILFGNVLMLVGFMLFAATKRRRGQPSKTDRPS